MLAINQTLGFFSRDFGLKHFLSNMKLVIFGGEKLDTEEHCAKFSVRCGMGNQVLP